MREPTQIKESFLSREGYLGIQASLFGRKVCFSPANIPKNVATLSKALGLLSAVLLPTAVKGADNVRDLTVHTLLSGTNPCLINFPYDNRFGNNPMTLSQAQTNKILQKLETIIFKGAMDPFDDNVDYLCGVIKKAHRIGVSHINNVIDFHETHCQSHGFYVEKTLGDVQNVGVLSCKNAWNDVAQCLLELTEKTLKDAFKSINTDISRQEQQGCANATVYTVLTYLAVIIGLCCLMGCTINAVIEYQKNQKEKQTNKATEATYLLAPVATFGGRPAIEPTEDLEANLDQEHKSCFDKLFRR